MKEDSHYRLTVQTQHGIIRYAEGMAQVLAEAGRASAKATGDLPAYAVNRWSEIIRKRALQILAEDAAPNLKQLTNMEKLLDEKP